MYSLVLVSIIKALSPLTYAELSYQKEIWSLKSTHFLMAHLREPNLVISENCVTSIRDLRQSQCEAAKIVEKKKSISLARNDLIGGKNPGAVVCSLHLKQSIIMLKDINQNESAFCQFSDKSMISAVSLTTLLKD